MPLGKNSVSVSLYCNWWARTGRYSLCCSSGLHNKALENLPCDAAFWPVTLLLKGAFYNFLSCWWLHEVDTSACPSYSLQKPDSLAENPAASVAIPAVLTADYTAQQCNYIAGLAVIISCFPECMFCICQLVWLLLNHPVINKSQGQNTHNSGIYSPILHVI